MFRAETLQNWTVIDVFLSDKYVLWCNKYVFRGDKYVFLTDTLQLLDDTLQVWAYILQLYTVSGSGEIQALTKGQDTTVLAMENAGFQGTYLSD